MKKSTWIWIAVLILFISGGLLYRRAMQEVDSRGATRLMRALEEKDTNKMRKFLEDSPDVHARDKSGQTALFYAARYAEDPLVLHKLVAAGADTLATDKHGYTPLMTAAEYNPSPRIIMTLARYGRFLEPQTENKNQALAVAARYNNSAVIKTLLTAGANPVGTSGQRATDLLAENPQLSDQEKTDWRHIMLVLEILDAREKFQRENYPRTAEKRTKNASTAAAGTTVSKPEPKPMLPDVNKTVPSDDKPAQATTDKPASAATNKLANADKPAQAAIQRPLLDLDNQPVSEAIQKPLAPATPEE